MVSVYSEAENRILNAEKAHLSTSDRRFPKGGYNILSSSELGQKGIGAQQLLDSKCRHLTASSVRPQSRCRRIEVGSSSGWYDSLAARKTQGKPIVAQALFHRYCPTSQPLSKLLTPTPNVIYNIGKQNADAHQASGLTSACIFRFLRREPCRQQQIVRPPTTAP